MITRLSATLAVELEVNMNKLRTWRLERGLSQMELADASQVKRWAIQLAESGLRALTPDERLAVAAALGVSEKRLFATLGPHGAAIPGSDPA